MAPQAQAPLVSKTTPIELLSVRVASHTFALDIRSVREIRGGMATTPLPHAPAFVRGMINLRGLVLAVVDLGERLGLKPDDVEALSVVVVVETGDRVVGLLVDNVSDIIIVDPDQIQTTPGLGSSLAQAMVSGVMNHESGIISILSVDAIIPPGAVEAVAAAAVEAA